jgi:hypothetical protein
MLGKTSPDDLVQRVDEHRLYHLMAGEDERAGGALLYFNLPPAAAHPRGTAGNPSSCDFLKMARRFPGVHVDIEKPFWWDVPVWIASGMVDSIGLCNNHMQRDGMLSNEAGASRATARLSRTARQRPLVGAHLLPAAGERHPSCRPRQAAPRACSPIRRVTTACTSTAVRSWTTTVWWKNLRAGQVVVTNGPLIRDPRVNDQLPGHVFQRRRRRDHRVAYRR